MYILNISPFLNFLYILKYYQPYFHTNNIKTLYICPNPCNYKVVWTYIHATLEIYKRYVVTYNNQIVKLIKLIDNVKYLI